MHAFRTTLRYPNWFLLGALALGMSADLLFYGRFLGISAPIFVALGLAVLGGLSLVEERLPTRANLWLAGAALFFAGWLAVRDSATLTFLNLCACLGLLLLLVASYRGEALARLPGWRYIADTTVSLFEMALRPVQLTAATAGSLSIGATQTRRLIPVGRGLILALPIVFVFTGLLMAADSVFASYVSQITSLRLPFDTSALVSHTLFVGIVGWICAGGLLVALRDKPFVTLVGPMSDTLPAEGETQPLRLPRFDLRFLGCVEALTVLVAVNLLFGGFMLIQGAYFFGGLDTLNRTGMTYAEYARRGFFELLTVACLSLAMLWTLAVTTRRDQPWQRHSFNAASALLIVLVLGLLASAFQRMLLYEAAYGYTELRLYTLSFMIWLALVLLLFLAALLRERPRLFTFGGCVLALLYLALLNAINPDAMIVRENIARYQATGKLDAYYLTRLSDDAVPALMNAFDTLNEEDRSTLIDTLSYRRERLAETALRDGWPGWHWGRAQALAALEGQAALRR